MNGPVVPAASHRQPGLGRSDGWPVGGRFRPAARVLLAPVRSLGFFGLTLAGAVLLAVGGRAGRVRRLESRSAH